MTGHIFSQLILAENTAFSNSDLATPASVTSESSLEFRLTEQNLVLL